MNEKMATDAELLDGLLDEVRLAFHCMGRLADDAHAPLGVTAPMRAVLEFLAREGGATVPRIADARGVSRQHIQSIANELIEAGLVQRRENPVHARSWLLELTGSGQDRFAAIAENEADLRERVAAAVPARDVARASRTLAAVRAELEALASDFRPRAGIDRRFQEMTR